MEISNSVLSRYPENEKAAYLGVLAALSTANREASNEELNHLHTIADAAGISADYENKIIHSATDITGQNLKSNLDILKESDLKYSLIADLIAVAKVDSDYSEEDKTNIEKVSRYLNVSQNQFSVLDNVMETAAENPKPAEEYTKPNFLQSLGLQDKVTHAGLNNQGRNLLGFLGPIILGGLAAKSLSRNRAFGQNRGMLGGGLLGSLLAGGRMGGIGSLLSGLSTSRNTGNMGGMLGRLFAGSR